MARSLEQGQRELEAQNEELRQSERLKSQLVSIVSHELRNPLTSILGYTSLLRTRDFDKAESRRYLEIIQQQGNRLTSLIDHFLDSESVESGRIELDRRAVRPEAAARRGGEARRRQVDGAPDRGRDRRRARSRCAATATGSRRSSRTCSTTRSSTRRTAGSSRSPARSPTSVVRVHVRDEGIGVPDEHQPRSSRSSSAATPARAASPAPGSASPSRARSSRRTAATSASRAVRRGLALLVRAAARSRAGLEGRSRAPAAESRGRRLAGRR